MIFKKIPTQPIPEDVPGFPWRILMLLAITILVIFLNIFLFYEGNPKAKMNNLNDDKSKTTGSIQTVNSLELDFIILKIN